MCGPSGYAYAGIQPGQKGFGVAVNLASLTAPVVESGHVAGWVGVGGPGQGPGGTDEWIQAGLNSLPGTGNKLYYEVMRPGAGQTYAEVATDVPNGQSIRIAVLETSSTPGAWRVWVNGRAVTPAFMLSGSHGNLAPMAMGESWDGGRPACNRYAYRFDNVSVAAAPGGSWLPARDASVLQDPGYKVVKRASASFDAGAVSALAAPAPAPTPAAPSAPGRTQSVKQPATPAAPAVRVLASAQAISADSPLRKGFLPSPTEDAIFGITPVTTTQPALAQPSAAPAPSAALVPSTASVPSGALVPSTASVPSAAATPAAATSTAAPAATSVTPLAISSAATPVVISSTATTAVATTTSLGLGGAVTFAEAQPA